MEMVNSHSLLGLSTASTPPPQIAQKCCPIGKVCNFKNVLCSNGWFRSSFQLYFIDAHVYFSFNVPHLSE